MPRKMPAPGNVREVLKSVEKNFRGFATDAEMREMALIGLAQCVGAVAGWVYRAEGPDQAEKKLQMVYAMAFHTAQMADAVMRSSDERRAQEPKILDN